MEKSRRDFRKILLILIGRLGDYIVATPFFRAIRRKYPGAEITLLTSAKAGPLARKNGNFNEVLTFESWLNVPANLKFLFLGGRGFDLAVDLNPSYSRTSIGLVGLSGAPERVSFEKKSLLGIYTRLIPHDPENDHFLDKYEKIAGFFGASCEPRMNVEIDGEAAAKAEKTLKTLDFRPGPPLVAVHPGNFKKKNNRWPEEKFVKFTKKVLESEKINLFYLAGPGEEKITRARILNFLPGVKSLPPPDISVTAAILKKADLLVCNNTSTMHLADAVGTATLSFNSLYNEKCWRPRSENAFSLVSGDWNSCLNITVEEAVGKFLEVLPLVSRRAYL